MNEIGVEKEFEREIKREPVGIFKEDFCKSKMFSRSSIQFLVAAITYMLIVPVSGYTGPAPSNHRRRDNRRANYMPPSNQNSQVPPNTAQNMLRSVGAEQERGKNWRLSHSVLASCDTLPSFPTAHGILSPETVSRMDEITAGGNGNEAVITFLHTYRQSGPMSCLEMLSDPEVLPHLTRAMRDVL